jgi:hypothetical protein
MESDEFPPHRLRQVWIDVQVASGDADRLQSPQCVGPHEVTAADVTLLEDQLNLRSNTVRYVLERQRQSDGASMVTVTAHNL